MGELLLLKGAILGEFVATEFSNSLLQEHIISVSVTDIPHEPQVMLHMLIFLNLFSFLLDNQFLFS